MQAEIFCLAKHRQRFIKTLLLDRFLACMKPASITLRQLRAGVFFWLIGIMVECNSTKMLEPRNGQSALGGKSGSLRIRFQSWTALFE